MTSWTSFEAASRSWGACSRPSPAALRGSKRPVEAAAAAPVAAAAAGACGIGLGSTSSTSTGSSRSSSSRSTSSSQTVRYRRWRQYCCSQQTHGSSGGAVPRLGCHPLSSLSRRLADQPSRHAVAAAAAGSTGGGGSSSGAPQQGETLADVMGNIMQQLMAMQEQAAGSGSTAAHLHVQGLGYQPPGAAMCGPHDVLAACAMLLSTCIALLCACLPWWTSSSTTCPLPLITPPSLHATALCRRPRSAADGRQPVAAAQPAGAGLWPQRLWQNHAPAAGGRPGTAELRNHQFQRAAKCCCRRRCWGQRRGAGQRRCAVLGSTHGAGVEGMEGVHHTVSACLFLALACHALAVCDLAALCATTVS